MAAKRRRRKKLIKKLKNFMKTPICKARILIAPPSMILNTKKTYSRRDSRKIIKEELE